MKRPLFFISLLLIFGTYSCENFEDSENIILDRKFANFNDSLKLSDEFLRKEKLSKIELEFCIAVTNAMYYRGYNGYKKQLDLVEKQTVKNKDTTNIIKIKSYLGDYFFENNRPDSAYIYYRNAKNLASKDLPNINYAVNLFSIALIQYSQKDFIGCEKSTISALQYYKKFNKTNDIYDCYNLLAILNNELGEYNIALEYLNKCKELLKNDNLENKSTRKCLNDNNTGLVYQNQNQHDIAVKYFSSAIKEDSGKRTAEFHLSILNNLALSYVKLGKLNDGLSLFRYVYKSAKKVDQVSSEVTASRGLSEYYQILGDLNNSKYYAEKAYNSAKIHERTLDQTLALKQLIKVDRSNASKYAEEYIRISDSLQIAERRIRNKLARIEYETDELIVEKNSLIEQRKSIIYITLALLTIGAFVFIIRIQMAKNRELILIQQQQKANEEIYELMLTQQSKMEAVRQTEKRNIARELHDGVLGKLFGTRLNLGLLNEKNTEKAAEERIQFIEELKKIEQEIREISHDLSQEKAALVNNFVLVLRDYFEKQQQITSTNIVLEIADDIKWQEIDNVTKINLYRIMQECLQNINKHAQASEAQFTIKQVDTNLSLLVVDNGIGFNASKEKKGIGLKNIDLRVKQTKAIMEISSEKNKGTTFLFKFPLTSYS